MTDMAHQELSLDVIAGLGAVGISATFEYPGAVAIHFANSTGRYEVWTGLNGWEYGSVNMLVAGAWEPVEGEAGVAEPRLRETDTEASVIIDAWAAWVEERTEATVFDRVEAVAAKAAAAFWAAVAEEFPEISTGDLDPATAADVEQHMVYAVRAWVDTNAV